VKDVICIGGTHSDFLQTRWENISKTGVLLKQKRRKECLDGTVGRKRSTRRGIRRFLQSGRSCFKKPFTISPAPRGTRSSKIRLRELRHPITGLRAHSGGGRRKRRWTQRLDFKKKSLARIVTDTDRVGARVASEKTLATGKKKNKSAKKGGTPQGGKEVDSETCGDALNKNAPTTSITRIDSRCINGEHRSQWTGILRGDALDARGKIRPRQR